MNDQKQLDTSYDDFEKKMAEVRAALTEISNDLGILDIPPSEVSQTYDFFRKTLDFGKVSNPKLEAINYQLANLVAKENVAHMPEWELELISNFIRALPKMKQFHSKTSAELWRNIADFMADDQEKDVKEVKQTVKLFELMLNLKRASNHMIYYLQQKIAKTLQTPRLEVSHFSPEINHCERIFQFIKKTDPEFKKSAPLAPPSLENASKEAIEKHRNFYMSLIDDEGKPDVINQIGQNSHYDLSLLMDSPTEEVVLALAEKTTNLTCLAILLMCYKPTVQKIILSRTDLKGRFVSYIKARSEKLRKKYSSTEVPKELSASYLSKLVSKNKDRTTRELAGWLIITNNHQTEFQKLSKHDDLFVKILVLFAKDKQFTEKLSRDIDEQIRYHVATFANRSVLESMVNDNSEKVRAKIAERGVDLEKLSQDPVVAVRIASVKKAEGEVLKRLAKDPDQSVREAVLASTTDRSALEILATDDIKIFRDRANDKLRGLDNH